MAEEYKELSNKIEGVKDVLSKQMNDIAIAVATLVGSVNQLQAMKTDVDKARDNAQTAILAAESAHKRIDEIEKEIKPMVSMAAAAPTIVSAMDARVKKTEINIRWAAVTLIGYLLAGVMYFIKGG